MTAGFLGRPGAGRKSGSGFLLALAVPLIGGLVLLVPGASELLELDRARLSAGQLWRLATSNLAHYSCEHWLFDALAFLALGLACARRSARTGITLAVAAVAIPAAVLVLQPEIQRYRGLSGLDSALFGLLLACELSAGRSRRALLFGALFVAKILFELGTERSVFLDDVGAQFTPVPLAHALGGLLGFAFGFVPRPALAEEAAVS